MMTAIGICIFTISVIVSGIQAVMGWKLTKALRQPAQPMLSDEECPPVVAVLCLRGTDPFLPTMLRRLFALDYPSYRVRVVVDSANDPARLVVENAIRMAGVQNVDVLVLDRRDLHCAARSSSILKGTANLPDDCRIVAMFDGDVVLHPSCLRELVTSLVRQGAKAATGIRWFAPQSPTIGSIARLQWSLACSMMMYDLRLPWGGCLAMLREVIEDPELRDRISRSFGDDMLLGSMLDRRGDKLAFVTQSTIVNREVTSLKGLLNFLTRHMLYVRLNHHRWKWILGFGTLLIGLTSVVCPLGLLHATLRPWCLAGLVCLLVSLIGSAVFTGRAARAKVAERGEQLIPMTPFVVLLMLAAMPVTQLLTLLANMAACTTRQTTWRGLTYRFGKDPAVTLIGEVPVAQIQTYNSFAPDNST